MWMSLILSCLESVELCDVQINILKLDLGRFQLLFLQIFFSASFYFSFPSGTPCRHMLMCFVDVMFLLKELCSFLFFLFFRPDNLNLPFIRFTDSSAYSNPLLSLLVKFSFQLLYFYARIYIQFSFLIISTSVLAF